MKKSEETAGNIEYLYRNRYNNCLLSLSNNLERYIKDCLSICKRIDRVSSRPKSIDSFLKKANKIENGIRKYCDPINEIQDQLGARIVVFYQSDVEIISNEIRKYINFIEEKKHAPDHSAKFGYFGLHYIFVLPDDVVDPRVDEGLVPKFFELQIKTLFEHAWSEAEHDLGYKFDSDPLTDDQYRKLAFTSAQAWGGRQDIRRAV